MSWKNWNWKTYVAGAALIGSLLTVGKGYYESCERDSFIESNMPPKSEKFEELYAAREVYDKKSKTFKRYLGYAEFLDPDDERAFLIDPVDSARKSMNEVMEKYYSLAKDPEIVEHDAKVDSIKKKAHSEHASYPYGVWGGLSLIVSSVYFGIRLFKESVE